MLGFLSFIVVLTMLSATVGWIVVTIRNASSTIVSALYGQASYHVTFVTFSARPVRPSVPMRLRSAPMRAAA
jgi:hypothetical protein